MVNKDIEDQILKVAKEIVVKFIEVGRVSPANFGETFKAIYQNIRETVLSEQQKSACPSDS